MKTLYEFFKSDPVLTIFMLIVIAALLEMIIKSIFRINKKDDKD